MEKNREQKRLTLSEYDAIVAFDRLCFPEDHWTEEDWRELLADERAVYLALLDDGRIVGDVFVYNWQGERDYGKIMNLAVHPAYRRRRLAAGLRAATELLQAAGLPRICGETRLSNEAMRRTFAACGYRLTRIEEAYYDHPPESACKRMKDNLKRKFKRYAAPKDRGGVQTVKNPAQPKVSEGRKGERKPSGCPSRSIPAAAAKM